MAIGGLIIPSSMESIINQTMAQYRTECNMMAELKWAKVSDGKANEYRKFVDYFFALNDTDKVHFHAMILDTTMIDHRTYSQGDRELGFYKFYYQFLLHSFGKRYCPKESAGNFLVRLDARNSSYSLNTLKNTLNGGMKKKFNVTTAPFHSIEPRDSKQTELIQIADILLGAVGYQKNGYPLVAGSKKSKIELAAYIAKKAGLANLADNSPYRGTRFTIWNFRLSPRGSKN